jgi:hypothetical protein
MTAKLSKEQFILAIKLISLSDLEIRIWFRGGMGMDFE